MYVSLLVNVITVYHAMAAHYCSVEEKLRYTLTMAVKFSKISVETFAIKGLEFFWCNQLTITLSSPWHSL